ncbi:MAG: MraY family glycosyltransferase [Candidatus Sumerlaeia bacterium]|nr:MraY family glycosyltransferase [Candidatus Sumerlaeia bacterium]
MTDPALAFWLLAGAAFLQAALAGAILLPAARVLGRRLGLVDHPTLERKIHREPTPRSGGLAIFAAFWGCLWLDAALAVHLAPHLEFLPEQARALAANAGGKLPQLAALFAGAAIIFAVGAWDDRAGLSPRFRLAAQILACVPPILAGIHLNLFLPAPFGWAATVVWVLALTNSFNFLDNMNGVTSGLAIVCAAVLALVSALAREWYMAAVFALLAGSVVGFWRVNFLRGGIFLGDNGSTHLGYLFAMLTCLATYYEEGVPSRLPILMPALVLAVPLFDLSTVLWIRWRTGRKLTEGDTNHISHRLVALGFSRREAAVVLYAVALAVGLAAVALRQLDWRHGLLQTASIALLFAVLHRAERVSRRRADTPPR